MKRSVLARAKKRMNKYGVSAKEDRTRLGVLYDSKLEMKYAAKLDLLRHAVRLDERVVDIKRQVSIPLEVHGNLICVYRADFQVTFADGRLEYHETKGLETPEWRIKEKLFHALYPHTTLRVIKRA